MIISIYIYKHDSIYNCTIFYDYQTNTALDTIQCTVDPVKQENVKKLRPGYLYFRYEYSYTYMHAH